MESALRAPAVEETRAPEPAKAEDGGVATEAAAQAALENVETVVKLPLSSDKFGDLRDIDPAAAASAADRIAEFTSASEEILNAGTSEGPVTGRSSCPGSPWNFSAASRRRKPFGRRSLRSALRFRTTSTAPWSSTE